MMMLDVQICLRSVRAAGRERSFNSRTYLSDTSEARSLGDAFCSAGNTASRTRLRFRSPSPPCGWGRHDDDGDGARCQWQADRQTSACLLP